ncbi:MAG: HlyD family efflux transporter periplasmic adaptor subunit, partial [Chloroflexi bacterium]|nr:HlyD family efflux transporter periplasmic adaptor subunit [Chloroflexota bacterium]
CVIGIIVLAVLAGGALAANKLGMANLEAPQPAQSAASALPPVKSGDLVSAEGKVVPLQNAVLSLPVGGIVAEVLAAEGEQVKAGQVLARLESGKLRAAVAQAEAGVLKAEAHLDELTAEARPEEVEAAKATIAGARARAQTAAAGGRAEDVAAAEAGVASARARLDQVLQGNTNAELQAAEAEVAAARSQLQRAEADLYKVKNPDPDAVRQAQIDVERAKNNLWGLYVKRDGICGQVGKTGFECIAAKAAAAAEESNLHTAEENLRIRSAGGKPEDVASAQKAVESAKAQVTSAEQKLAQMRSGPTADEVAIAQAAVDQAEAQVAVAAAPPRPGTVAATEAEIRHAQAQLDLLLAGPRPEVVAAAKADVAAAKATLEQAKAALAETELRAPFAGTLASMDVKPGEQVTAGAQIARIADCSAWQIETTDLTELSVVRIREGSPVTIGFDAIPDLQVSGMITRIKSLGEKKQGDIVYTVIARPNQYDDRLRWNMTASISIESGATESASERPGEAEAGAAEAKLAGK